MKALHVNRQTIRLWHNLGPWGWVRPKQTSSQKELRSWRLAAPSMTMRTEHSPHQEAKGTRRAKTSVHVRLSDRWCTEHCLLFARTPKRRVVKKEHNLFVEVCMEHLQAQISKKTIKLPNIKNALNASDVNVRKTATSRIPLPLHLQYLRHNWTSGVLSLFQLFYFVYLIRNRYKQPYVMCKDQEFASIFIEKLNSNLCLFFCFYFSPQFKIFVSK